jgi:hypothetical protein
MKNSSESEKSKGVVVFAFNTSDIDYVGLADKTSRLTQHYLNLPITLITDENSKPKFEYDNVIRINAKTGNFRSANGIKKEWRNFDRYTAYELSPYDTTILLDGDYLVLDDSLLVLLEQDFDYKLMHQSRGYNDLFYSMMGSHGLPFVWATVVLFNKSQNTEQYFNLIKRIQNNYPYYKTLYNCNGSYRNDYAFAIANIILNGYSVDEYKGIPWSMLTVEQSINDIELKNNFLVVRQETAAHVIVKQNIHVMDKKFLMSENFNRFVNNVIG